MTAYLSRTPSGAGNRRTMTWSFWIKFNRGENASYSSSEPAIMVYGDAQSGYPSHRLLFYQGKAFFYSADDAAQNGKVAMESGDIRFRDPSAWYHFVYTLDTTAGSAAARQRVWVNGVAAEVNGNGGWVQTDAGQNKDTDHNGTETIYIGKYSSIGYFDGQIADYHFIDGQAKIHTDFGQFDSTSGIWKPKKYSGTFSGNSFYLKGENAGNIGLDSSGLSNNFTVNGTNVYQSEDTPSNNFALLNFDNNRKDANARIINGGLTILTPTGAYAQGAASATLAVSKGKWYWEGKVVGKGGYQNFGFCVFGDFKGTNKRSLDPGAQTDNSAWLFYTSSNTNSAYDQKKVMHDNANVLTSFGPAISENDIIMVALDLDNGKCWWGVNGTWLDSGSGTGVPASGTYPHVTFTVNPSGEGTTPVFYSPLFHVYCYGEESKIEVNFGATGKFGNTALSSAQADNGGNGTFEFSPPNNFYSLCTNNIADYG